MKVLLLNGSPRKEGCTYTALSEVALALQAEGIETEIFQAGNPEMEIGHPHPDRLLSLWISFVQQQEKICCINRQQQ